MKKLIALLTLAALPVIGLAGVAHADEDHGTPPVNPTITHIVVHGSGTCPTTDPECRQSGEGGAPITHIVVTAPTPCPAGDPECNAPATTAPTGEDAAPAAVVATPVTHRTVKHSAPKAYTSADYGQAVLSLMVPGLFAA